MPEIRYRQSFSWWRSPVWARIAAAPDPITAVNHVAMTRALGGFNLRIRPLLGTGRLRILLLSPSLHDISLVRQLCPGDDVVCSVKTMWNLDHPPRVTADFDLAIASNVFLYASDIGCWFDTVLSRASFLLLQDVIDRRRSATPPYLGPDGDCSRFSYASRGEISPMVEAFDLQRLEPNILYFDVFNGDTNEHHAAIGRPPRHFCAIVRSLKATRSDADCLGLGLYRLCLYAVVVKETIKALLRWRGRTPG